MGGATNCPETPRQKMIGMMYLVLTAMLAMNVSADILLGFRMVEESLQINTRGSENRNVNVYDKFQSLNDLNPGKIGPWLKKAKTVKAESDKLYEDIEQLKIMIVEHADGKSALEEAGVYKRKSLDGYEVEATSNLDAAGWICLEEGGPRKGKEIRESIEKYKAFLLTMVVSDTAKVSLIKKTFNTDKAKSHGELKPWEFARFEMQPVAAVTTILSKIQADVRSIEGEVITYLKGMVDADDFRVNKIQALVIPESKYVTQGDQYQAKIILAASDSTQKPQVFMGGDYKNGVGGTIIENGDYKTSVNKIGESKYAGYIKVFRPDGSSKFYTFESEYFVSAPSATISADKMNVFYAGIDNDVSVSVPGYPSSLVNATMVGGSLVKSPKGGYIARPAKVGQECIISAYAKVNGKDKPMGKKNFRVKMLPPPIAFIPYRDESGNKMKYKGNEKIAKKYLLAVTNLEAELDDADIEAEFRVLAFELNVSNAMGTQILSSSGPSFTDAQISYMKTLSKGKKFFIGGVKAIGPDRIERKLPPMEVLVN